jgi:hypothetical protein
VDCVPLLHRYGVRCVLDMHDVLWQSYARQLDGVAEARGWSRMPRRWKEWAVARYRAREEAAWRQFDRLIAINRAEAEYARRVVAGATLVSHVPMGTDLELWPYSWMPARPPRLAYYGALGNPDRQREALRCARAIMVVASPDAVYGMDLEPGAGLFLEATEPGMTQACLRLLEDRQFAEQHSRLARAQVEPRFSLAATYGRLAGELRRWCEVETRHVAPAPEEWRVG